MWDLYLLCKTWGESPSKRMGWPCFANRLTAWKFDTAVMFVGLTIENALQERTETGKGASYRSEPRYTLTQLLDPVFRLPRPPRTVTPSGDPDAPGGDGLAWLMAMSRARGSGVVGWQYVPPETEKAV